MSNSLDAKIVVLGAQGVGKTSLVVRYVKNTFTDAQIPSTIGASFVTKRIVDTDSNTTVRLQIWDTAGQERFRSISKLYYRGANAGVLCYDITNEKSFDDMAEWLIELRKNMPSDIIYHVVGTKADVVHKDPSLRAVPFEKCIAFVAQQLSPDQTAVHMSSATTPAPKRSSSFWGQDAGWDTCHEVSSMDGEGIEEVFRVITRKLVEQRNKQTEAALAEHLNTLDDNAGSSDAELQVPGTGSFRLGIGEHRRSWLRFQPGLSQPSSEIPPLREIQIKPAPSGRCC